MHKDIAVFLGANEESASLYEQGKIVVFRKSRGQWDSFREMPFSLDQCRGLKGLRDKMTEAVSFLDDCGIFVALAVSGVPYFELEKAQCSIWEFQGKPGEFLDYILAKEEEEREFPAEKSSLQLAPVETGEGRYKISLKEVQESNSGITSKQVLLPFLRQGNFYELEVLCSHLPPWLEAELATGKFNSQVETIDRHEVRVIISKKCCHQC